MLDTDKVVYLGEWDAEVYGSAFDEADEAAGKPEIVAQGASHWILDEEGLSRVMRTARDAALRAGIRNPSDHEEYAVPLRNGYELRLPKFEDDEVPLYVRLVDTTNDEEVIYWDAKEFEDIERVLPALFGTLQRAVGSGDFSDIGYPGKDRGNGTRVDAGQ